MRFELATTALEKGVTRLEASAGTGKTFALAGLFLRLVLEEKVPARDILVVTFTQAATAELRDRIRRRLSEALAVFNGKSSKDELLIRLAGQMKPHGDMARSSLRAALDTFDLVSIYTIHGFCQRTLQDSAFESGILFDVELVANQDDLVRQTAADYCRNQFHGSDEVLATAAAYAKLNPDALARLLRQYLAYPALTLVTSLEARGIKDIAHNLRAAFDRCTGAWRTLPGGPAALLDYFLQKPKWSKGDHAKRERLQENAGYMDTCLDMGTLTAEIWEAARFFSLSEVMSDVGSNKQLPQPAPPLFTHCEELASLATEYATAHRLAFLQGTGKILAQAKQDAKRQSYEDLISRLADALESDSGLALASSVRRRYRAALIDESQDTDPLQWKIFQRVFAQSSEHWLYLIGDPKQAIYGFRGADVHTYLQAAAKADQEYSLDTNWRSESALVRAVNAIFSSAGRTAAFLEENIAFEAVSPGPKADEHPIRFSPGGRRPPPFQVWCWESAKGAVSSKAAQKQLPASVAAEISRLLNGEVHLGERGDLRPGDIAVLVESHRQAGWIQTALHGLGIPSVEQAMESVFESGEARELQWILAAVLAPGRESAVKSALTTDALGLNGSSLQELTSDEGRWQSRLQTFAKYREAWEEDGFFFMFARLLREEKVIENLLRFPDAERRITNLLHVAELLEAACIAEHLGPSRLVQWLEERRTGDEAALDAYQLRLESDEDAVQIVTIHRSKGLQYPVVFCPFVCKDAKLKQIKVNGQKVLEVVLYHDPKTGHLTWDLSDEPDEERRQLAGREQLAEKVRLLYVALTRACNRCYLVSARYARNKSTALAWLMHRPSGVPADPVEALDTDTVVPGRWKDLWHEVAAASGDGLEGNPGVAVADLPTEAGNPWTASGRNSGRMAARSCAREIKESWFLSSFTQLASQVSSRSAGDADGSSPDYDEVAVGRVQAGGDDDPAAVPTGIFALPPGVRTGDCLHKIIERFDFAAPDDEKTRSLIQQQLEAANLWDPTHAAALAKMLECLRHRTLDPENSNLKLANVPARQRLTEMEFQFPTAQLDARQLVGLIRIPGSATAGSDSQAVALPHSAIAAFLKGFIDLVFEFEGRYHIVDWKSNLLGSRAEDYSPEAMQRAIRESYYDLQYHIYTVALDKYLRHAVPGYSYEEHFGGVHYVFLRGLDPALPDLGIFHDRPSAQAVERLSSLLGTFQEVMP